MLQINDPKLLEVVDRVYQPIAERLRGHKDFYTRVGKVVNIINDLGPKSHVQVIITYQRHAMDRMLTFSFYQSVLEDEKKSDDLVDEALVTLIGWINRLYMN